MLHGIDRPLSELAEIYLFIYLIIRQLYRYCYMELIHTIEMDITFTTFRGDNKLTDN